MRNLPPKSGCISYLQGDCVCVGVIGFANRGMMFIQPLFGGRLVMRWCHGVGKPTWGYDYTTVLRRLPHPSSAITHRIAHPHRPPSIYMRFGDALLRRPRKRSRLQLTPDRVGGTRTDAYASRSAAAERSIAKCRKLGRR